MSFHRFKPKAFLT